MNTDTNTEFLGTCPVCFNSHVVTKGVMIKHGWMEVGGREVGVYGQAWHSGSCYAVGCLPFEVSCETTKKFLAEVAIPDTARWERTVARLRTRPELTVLRTEYVRDDNGYVLYHKRKAVTRTVAIVCTETNEFGAGGVYDNELAKELRQAEACLQSTKDLVTLLTGKIAAWAPAEMPEYHGKTVTRHLKREGAKVVACGSRSYGLVTTSTESDVTCTRCLKALATAAAEKAARDAVAADRDAFIAFVKAAGKPVSGKAVRMALGWDIKRWNKASDRSYNYGIDSVYEKNIEYFTVKM